MPGLCRHIDVPYEVRTCIVCGKCFEVCPRCGGHVCENCETPPRTWVDPVRFWPQWLQPLGRWLCTLIGHCWEDEILYYPWQGWRTNTYCKRCGIPAAYAEGTSLMDRLRLRFSRGDAFDDIPF